jgi:sugar phosphate isomerase/epimerase
MSLVFSRRAVLKRSALATVAAFNCLHSFESLAANDTTSSDLYGGLPMGIQSYSLRKFDLLPAIRLIQRLGLHRVEFFETHLPLNATPEQLDYLKRLLSEAKIVASGQFVGEFGKDAKANRNIFAFLQQAGIRNIVTGTPPDSLDGVEPLAKEFNIRVLIHNHGPATPYDTLASVQRAITGRDKLIGACVDTGHVLRSGEDPVEWLHALKGRVCAIHIKDVAEMKDQTNNVVIGRGHLDVVGVFRAIREIEFPQDGSLSMEYENNPDNPVDDIAESLSVARRAIAQLKS